MKSLRIASCAALWVLGCSNPSKPPPEQPKAQLPEVGPPEGGPKEPTATPGETRGTTELSPSAHKVKTGPVEVQMRVEAKTTNNPDPHEIENGESLKSGDRVALHVSVDQPAFVYVAQAAADGKATRIFPDSGDVLLTPEQPVRIPPAGHWFKLDQNTGQENFFVYGAKEAIPQATLEARMKADANKAKHTTRPAAGAVGSPVSRPNGKKSGKKHESSGGLSSSERGLEEIPEGEDRGLVEVSDGDGSSTGSAGGIVGKRFFIRHR